MDTEERARFGARVRQARKDAGRSQPSIIDHELGVWITWRCPETRVSGSRVSVSEIPVVWMAQSRVAGV